MPPSLSDSRRGILWMLLAMLMFAAVNAIAKHLAQSMPVLEALWARYVFHGLVVAIYLGRRLPATVATRQPGLQFIRSALTATTTGLMFLAVHLLTLVEVSAIMLLTPLILTVLAIPMLGEAVGRRRLVAVGVGFAGALIIIRPGSGVFQAAALVPMVAAFTMALYQITTRLSGRRDPVMTSVAYTPLVGLIGTSAAMPFLWVAPSAESWGFMAAIGLFGAGAQAAQIKAFTIAPAATVAPLLYTGLIWAIILDLALFANVPETITLAGALIVAASGLYVYRRDHAVAARG